MGAAFARGGLRGAVAGGLLHRLRPAGGDAAGRREGHRRRRGRRGRRGGGRQHGAPQAVTVTFNRPYLLLITAKATGEPLFLAEVDNPAAS